MNPTNTIAWKSHFEPAPSGVTYLNHAGSSQIPLTTTLQGIKYLQWKQHPWVHDHADNADNDTGEDKEEYDQQVRVLYSQLIQAESCNCIAFAPSTSFGMTMAAQNILRSGALDKPCRLLITESEEDSNVYPWQNICSESSSQAQLEVVLRPDLSVGSGESWGTAIINALSRQGATPVRVLALSVVHWCEGAYLEVEKVAEHLREMPLEKRPYFIIDGTQSIGALPFDVMALDADFVACSVHKWLLSPYGTSILYLNPRHHQSWLPLDQHERYRLGNIEAEWVEYGGKSTGDEYYPTPFMSGARRVNCGGHASPVNFSMIAASLQLILQWTVPSIQARMTSLTTFLATCLENKGSELGLSVIPATMRCGHIMGIRVNIDVAKIALADLGRKLKDEGILVTIRHSNIRVSPYVHNTEEDMQRVADTLELIIKEAQKVALQCPKKVVLLIGGSGWLGQQIVSAFRNPITTPSIHSSIRLTDTHELHVTFLSSRPYFLPEAQCHQLDLSSATECQDLVAALSPDIVINTAAMSSPVACSKQPEQASAINCPNTLIDALRTRVPDALVLFTSTDLVYDGERAPYSPTPVGEILAVSSNNVYGSTKQNCEREICSLSYGLVFRLSNMVGGNYVYAAPRNGGMKFLSWIQQSLELRSTVSLKDDELRSFVLSGDVTNLLLSVCTQYAMGMLPPSHSCWNQRVYNAGGPQGFSRLEFARIVAAAQDVELEIISKESSPRSPSSRNKWAVESVSSLQMAYGVGKDLSTLTADELCELKAKLPPRDVTMDSTLTESHFSFRFESIENGIDSCLRKI